jgi:hypothetical protein
LLIETMGALLVETVGALLIETMGTLLVKTRRAMCSGVMGMASAGRIAAG